MVSPYRRPGWLRRQTKSHPRTFALAIVCAAIIVVEVAAVTNFFGLLDKSSPTTAPTEPKLNPYDEEVVTVVSEVTYTGASSGYLAELENQELCQAVCPNLTIYTFHDPPEIGLYFYFNVTNTASHGVNISQPVLGISGTNQSVFYLQTFCCYTHVNQPYDEPLTVGLKFLAAGQNGSTIGLKGYIYSTWPVALSPSNVYHLYFNVTSD
jgi:hypothetical protein